MDAYSDSLMRLSNARLNDLHREAGRDRLARSVRRATLAARLPNGRSTAELGVATAPVSLPAPVAAEEELRRSA